LKKHKYKRPDKESLPKKIQELISDKEAELLLNEIESFAELLVEHMINNG
jgi:hypothetical protein